MSRYSAGTKLWVWKTCMLGNIRLRCVAGNRPGRINLLPGDARRQPRLRNKLGYARKVLPGAIWGALGTPVRGGVHLILAVTDHFEPAIHPLDGYKRVPRSEQER